MARRIGESGNIFFTLFGAVALVGVIGVATSNLMRGPVGTVMKLNQMAKAESQLQIARKLTALEAAQQANTDCDGDGFLEPIAPDTSGACSGLITGGGCIPSTIGVSQNDPWGTRVGYCAWDHGPVVGNVCASGLLGGTNGSTETVIAIVSAGADRTFDSDCQADPNYITETGDDIVMLWTYDDAIQGAGGLWALKSGDPNTAQTVDGRNIEVGGGATFQSGADFASNLRMTGSGARLDLTAGSLLNLPDDSAIVNCSATPANDRALRINTSAGMVLQICDYYGTNDWVDIGGSGAASSVYGSDGDIQLNSNGALYAVDNFNYDWDNDRLRVGGSTAADDTLEVTGTADISSDLEADAIEVVSGGSAADVGLSFNSAGTLGVYGSGATVGLAVGGSTRLSVNGTGAAVTGTFSAGDTTITNTTVNGTLTVSGDITDGGGPVTVNDALDVTGNITNSATGTVTVDDNLVVNESFVADSFELSPVGSNDGLFSDGSGGVILRADGGDIEMDGNVGVALGGAPTADIDIGGSLRLRTNAGAVAGGVCTLNGEIAYTSGDELLICSDITGNWETIGTTGGGGGGGGGIWERTTGVIRIRPDDFSNTDDFVVGSLSLDDEGSGAEDERMFFENATGAFRAGAASDGEWDTRGNYSIGLGYNTQATTDNTIAIGNNAQARATDALALGRDVTVAAGALQSMGVGLGISGGVDPQVSGTESLGIFMQDQAGVDFAADNTVGIFGGRLLIDPNEPATELAVDGSLAVDIEGDIGAVNFCREDGAFCFTAEDVATGATGAPGNDREIIYNSNGSLATDLNFVFSSVGNFGIGTASPSEEITLIRNQTSTTAINVQNTNANLNAGSQVLLTADSGDAYFDLTSTAGGGHASVTSQTAGGLRLVARNAAGEISLWTGASPTEQARILSSGEFGIGTSTPQTLLDVDGTIKMSYGGEACDPSRQGAIHFDSGGEEFYVCQDGVNWQRVITAGGGGAGIPAGGSDRQIQYNSGGSLDGDANFVFTSAGRMGLGNAAPSQTLDVTGTANVSAAVTFGDTLDVTGITTLNNNLNVIGGGTAVDFEGTFNADGDATLGATLDVTGQVDFSSGLNVAQTTNLSDTLNVTGIATFADDVALKDGLATDPALTFTNDTNTGLYRPSDDTIGVAVNGGESLRFTSTGALVINDVVASVGAETLLLDVEGAAGAQFFCDETGNDCFTAAAVAGGGAPAPGADTQIVYNSGGVMYAGPGLIYEMGVGGSQLGVGQAPRFDWNVDIYDPNDGAEMVVSGSGAGQTNATYFALENNAKNSSWAFSHRGDSFSAQEDKLLLSYSSGATIDVLVLSSAGNVGVGTSSAQPVDAALEVNGTLKIANGGEACDADREGAIHFDTVTERFYVCQDTAEGWVQLATDNATAADPDRGIQFKSGDNFAAAANFVYTSAGRLGLGTAAPSYTLDVVGDSNITGIATFADDVALKDGLATDPALTFTNDTNTGFYRPSDDTIGVAVNGGESLRFTSTGALVINDVVASVGAQTLILDVEGAAGAQFFCDETGNNCFSAAAVAGGGAPAPGTDTQIVFNSGGVLFAESGLTYDHANGGTFTVSTAGDFTFTSAGLLGVGTVTPGYTLDVVGTTNISGAATLGSSLGVTGQVDFSSGLNVTLGTNLADTLDVSGATTLDGLLTTNADSNLGGLVTFTSSGAVVLPAGTTGEQPDSPSNGMIRYNTDNDKFEAYQGGTWEDIITSAIGGGAADPDRGIQFKSGQGFAADANFVYTSAGNMVLGNVTENQSAVDRAFSVGSFNTGEEGAIEIVGAKTTDSPVGQLSFWNATLPLAAIQSERSGTNNSGALVFGVSDTGTVNEAARFTSAGRFGVGVTDPSTILDIAGTIQVADGGETCSAVADGGMVRWDGSVMQYCDGATWQNFASGATASPDAPDRGIQFNSGGAFTADANFTYTSVGRLGLGTASPVTEFDVEGSIQIAYDGETCLANPAMEGAVRFDAGTFYFCADNATGWESITLGSGTLAALGDTDIVTPADGQLLYYSGGDWINYTYAIDDLSDGYKDTTYQNMFLGHEGGVSLTTDNEDNLGIGIDALISLSGGTGDNNTAVGIQAMQYTTTGARNTALGDQALLFNETGNNNVAVGRWAIREGTSGNNNIGIGASALRYSSGNSNVAIGDSAATNSADANQNVAIGDRSLHANETGDSNVAIGYQTLEGEDGLSDISDNTAIGSEIGKTILSGSNRNTIIGHEAIWNFETGVENVILGAGQSGNNNGIGDTLVTGSNNILIGDGNVDVPFDNISDYINIGDVFYGSMGTGELFIGGSGAVTLPAGAMATRPGDLAGTTAVNGMIRYNTTSDKFEAYQGGTWQDILTSAVAGGASAPDRGIQFNSGGDFAASVGLVYSSTGNVGIGTTTPVADLEIERAGQTAILGLSGDNSASNSSAITLLTERLVVDEGLGVTVLNPSGGNKGWAISTVGENYAFIPELQGMMSFRYYDGASNIGDTYLNMSSSGTFKFATNSLTLADTRVEIDGTLKIGYEGEACDADREGAVRYVAATDTFSFCATQTNGWETVSLGAGTLAALSDTDISAPADGQLLYYSGGDWINYTYAIDDLTDAFTNYSSANMYMGQDAGTPTSPGEYNIAIGPNALNSMDGVCPMGWNCNENIAIGYNALTTNTVGDANVAIGYRAYEANTTGGESVAVGREALLSNVDGEENTAIGDEALRANVTGSSNVAVGDDALRSIVDSGGNTAVGHSAMLNITSGNGNSAFGVRAMRESTYGQSNTAIGTEALQYVSSNYNTAVGSGALRRSTTGERNSAFGHDALQFNQLGDFNVAIGLEAGEGTAAGLSDLSNNVFIGYSVANDALTGADNNTMIGYQAGSGLTTGASNILIGSGVSLPTGDTSNYINIGDVYFGSADTGFARMAGTIQIANSGEACTAETEGAIRYDAPTDTFAFCALEANDWETVSLGSGTLAALTDTNIAAPADGQILYFSGSDWVNNTLNLDDLGDVDTTGFADGDVLLYSAGLSDWVPGTVDLGASNFTDLADTPANYSGQAGRFARVNSGESALEFTDEIIESVSGEPAPNTINLNDLGDVSASATDGQFLTYDDASSNWIAADIGTAGGLWTAGSGSSIYYNSGTPTVGIGVTSPVTTLDVAGAIKFASTSLACDDPSHEGMLQFGSGGSNIFEACANSGSGWEQLALGGTVAGALGDLSDVDTTGFADGEVLLYSAGAGSWVSSPADLSSGNFTDLADTPASYSGQAGRFARVNSGESALEFTDEVIRTVTGEPLPDAINLNDLGDVSASATDGQFLTYDSNSGNWIAADIGTAGGLWTAGSGSSIYYNSGTPTVGIGVTSPVTTLDVAGAIKFASTSLACDDPSHEGMLQFGSGGSNIFEACANSVSGWEQLALGGTVAGGLDDLSDVNVTSVTDGQYLSYNDSTSDWEAVDNPSLWTDSGAGYIEYDSAYGAMRVANIAGASAPTGATRSVNLNMNDLGDVDTTGVADDQILLYSGGSWVIGDIVLTSSNSVTTAGNDREIQFNDNGTLGADANLVFSSQGYLGVGTAAPSVEVEVVGDIRSDSLILNTVNGNAPTYTSLALNSLSDVDTTGFADGEVILYSAGSGNWISGSVSASVTDINDIGNVDTTGFADGEVLFYSAASGNWVSGTVPSGYGGLWTAGSNDDIYYTSGSPRVGIGTASPSAELDVTGDVNLSGYMNLGQISGNAPTYVSAGYFALGQLTDVDTTGFADGEVLLYSAGAGGWVPGTALGGSVTPAGTDREIQFNDGGTALGADTNLVYSASGYLGVGTATPSNELHVVGDIRLSSSLIFEPVSGISAPTYISAGGFALNDLTDVDTAGFADGEVLLYSAGAGGWIAGTAGSSSVTAAGADTYIQFNSAGSFDGSSNLTWDGTDMSVTGNIEYTGTITDISDMRLKTDIVPLDADDVISRLAQIDTYSFRMKDDPDGRIELGVMAQEVEKAFPELVKTANDEMGTKSVNYVGFVAPLIEASKELKAENDMLRAELQDMKLSQAEFKDDIMKEVKGLKAHTGYGIDKAQIGLWMIALIMGISSLFFLVGVIIRQRQHKQG